MSANAIDPAHCRFCREACGFDYRMDTRASNLGAGDGWHNGVAWAELHSPGHPYPISNCRADDFALGFYRAIIARWCPVHPFDPPRNHCLATWPCQQRVFALGAIDAIPSRIAPHATAAPPPEAIGTTPTSLTTGGAA